VQEAWPVVAEGGCRGVICRVVVFGCVGVDFGFNHKPQRVRYIDGIYELIQHVGYKYELIRHIMQISIIQQILIA